MSEPALAQLVCTYLDRVVNRRDVTAVDELVATTYRGTGQQWPTSYDELREFYLSQYSDRPDWHIDVEQVIELGDSVVVRAEAGGSVTVDGTQRSRRLAWLAHYRFVGGLISEIHLLAFEPGSAAGSTGRAT